MVISSIQAEEEAVLETARALCAAARTAPRTRGLDYLKTCIVTGDQKERLAEKMEALAEETGMDFLRRDAGNVRNSAAVVLMGHPDIVRGLNEGCQYCGFKNCKECVEKGGRCAYISIDIGIALGSAISVAADRRIDNRVMFSIGRAAMELDFFEQEVCQAFGIPLSATGKSPYFDRK